MRRRLLATFAVLVAAWILACLVFFVWPPAETGAPAHASAIVVLSGATDRLPPALALIRRGVARALLISSVADTPKWTHAYRLCRLRSYARATVICLDAHPYSTRGEAETFSRVARARHWTSLVVVSSTYHLTRAKLLFDRCYKGRLWLVGASAPWWRQPLEWASETGKLIVQLTAERSC